MLLPPRMRKHRVSTVICYASIVGTVSVAGTTMEVSKYGAMIPITSFKGDMESVALYAGESCSLIHDSKSAAEIVQDVVREAEEVMVRL
jgi:nitronate monooxygenase